jgi:PTH1 family peptidyl-tRNA hydrolase
MKLIVGLGNPGSEYAETRHNLGFAVVDRLADRCSASLKKRKFSGRYGEGQVGEHRVVLLKPTTYMNRSGQSVLAACQFYKVARNDLLIVLDDLDLPLGRLRLRGSGSGGGHRGLENILLRLADQEVPRLRIGIGKVAKQITVGHVLSRFDDDELPLAERAIERAVLAVECWVCRGMESAMNEFNRPEDDQES